MVELVRAPASRRDELGALLRDYIFEFDGSTGYPYLDAYWQEAARLPFFLERDGEVVGFCLVRLLDGGGWSIAEFSTLPDRRRRGIGRESVAAVAAEARAAGAPFLQAKIHPHNGGALRFWTACGFGETERGESGVVITRLAL